MSPDELFLELNKHLEKYIHKSENLDLIKNAYLFAKEKHANQLRKSGEPYITHPLSVAIILADLHAGPSTIAAGILHDTLEDTKATFSELEGKFGADVAQIVDGVTKVTELNFVSLEKSQADNHQKMIIAMAKDIRVVIVKIADRLHNMRTLEFQPPAKQIRISNETIEIYAPLAHKLGMFKIKAELEDIALKYINPSMYQTINYLIRNEVMYQDDYINKMCTELSGVLKKNNVQDFEIKGRIKNVYSIYKKMITQNKTFEDIYDILAFRIIVDKVEDCYYVLGVIHANYVPMQRRFKDYIAVPKPNMYQSLHSTILSGDGKIIEIQIRTKEMDDVAEFGVAAHWAYKENANYSKEKEQFEIASKLKWYADLLEVTAEEEKAEDSSNLVNIFKEDILDANVYVYTPKGDVIALPKGSTPIDFAYHIHTDIGNHTVGATVNNKIVSLSYELKTGDVVSMRINKNSGGPNEDWIKICKTNHAKQKIRNYLNKLNHDTLTQEGKEDLDREMELAKIDEGLTDEFVQANFSRFGANTVQELYKEIGKGLIASKSVINRLQEKEVDIEEALNKKIAKGNRILTTNSQTGIVVEGLKSPKIKLASCCSPVPEDEVVGFVSKTNGIVVHRADCKNLETLEDLRKINVYWAEDLDRKYPAMLKIYSTDRNGFVASVLNLLNTFSINVLQLNASKGKDLQVTTKLKILVKDASELVNIMVNLQKINGVYRVERA